MNEKERKLLFADLCARVPYRVMVRTNAIELAFDDDCDDVVPVEGERDCEFTTDLLNEVGFGCYDVRPYLRPLNTITDTEVSRAIGIITGGVSRWSERDKRWYYIVHDPSIGEIESDFDLDYFAHGYYGIDNMDFLNSHHFDYRGLIERGLALEAPEGMYEPEKII